MEAILIHAIALSQNYACWTEYFHHTSIILSRTPTPHIHINQTEVPDNTYGILEMFAEHLNAPSTEHTPYIAVIFFI